MVWYGTAAMTSGSPDLQRDLQVIPREEKALLHFRRAIQARRAHRTQATHPFEKSYTISYHTLRYYNTYIHTVHRSLYTKSVRISMIIGSTWNRRRTDHETETRQTEPTGQPTQ